MVFLCIVFYFSKAHKNELQDRHTLSLHIFKLENVGEIDPRLSNLQNREAINFQFSETLLFGTRGT